MTKMKVEAETKLKALNDLTDTLLEAAVEASRRSLPDENEYEQGRKDAIRLIQVLLRDDPSIIENAMGF